MRYRKTKIVQPELLARQIDREFAVVDTRGEFFGISGRRVLAISRNQFRESGEQAGLRHAIVIDTIKPGFRPRFMQIA